MQFDPDLKRLSPLYNQHQTLKARFDLLGGWLIPKVYTSAAEETTVLRENVGLIDISARGKLIIKGAHSHLVIAACFGEVPTKSGEFREIRSNRVLVVGLTSDEFLILTPPGMEKEWGTSLEVAITSQNVFVSVIDQTSGLVELSISGPKSRSVMTKLCALPFNSKDFPDLCVAQSSFAQVRTTILRHDRDESPAFELFADRSYGEYLWDAILDAGQEFGIQPVGWEAIS